MRNLKNPLSKVGGKIKMAETVIHDLESLSGIYIPACNLEIHRDFRVNKGEKLTIKKCSEDMLHRFLITRENNDCDSIEAIFFLEYLSNKSLILERKF